MRGNEIKWSFEHSVRSYIVFLGSMQVQLVLSEWRATGLLQEEQVELCGLQPSHLKYLSEPLPTELVYLRAEVSAVLRRKSIVIRIAT